MVGAIVVVLGVAKMVGQISIFIVPHSKARATRDAGNGVKSEFVQHPAYPLKATSADLQDAVHDVRLHDEMIELM